MSNHLTRDTTGRLVNSIHPHDRPLDDDSEDDLTGIVRVSRERLGMKHDTVARLLGRTPSRLTDELAGRKQLPFRSVWRLRHDPDGRLIQREINFEMAMRGGWDLRRVLGLAMMDRIDRFEVALQMAKASIPDRDELERRIA